MEEVAARNASQRCEEIFDSSANDGDHHDRISDIEGDINLQKSSMSSSSSRCKSQRVLDDPDSDVSKKAVFHDWSGNTSIHGIPWILDTGSKATWYRGLWLVFTLVGAAIMIWQFESLIRAYRKFDVTTDTNYYAPRDLEFPDVTFCNLNPFMKSKKEKYNITDPRNEEELRLISNELNEFVISTSFNQDSLNVSEVWRESINRVGARCFTFSTDEHVSVPGMESGLHVTAWLHQDEYEADTAPFAGVMVFVTQKGTPINDQIPFTIAPAGEITIVGIQSTFYRRVTTQPWSRCFGIAPNYTAARCREESYRRAVRNSCGCREVGDERQKDEIDYCTKNQTTQCKVFLKGTSIVSEPYSCTLPACTETLYDTQQTTAEYSRAFMKQQEELWGVASNELLEDFVYISVNFERIRYALTVEKESMSVNELLAQIGGSMGLFLGFSALSLFELADLFFVRLLPRYWGVRHLYGLGGKKKAHSHDN